MDCAGGAGWVLAALVPVGLGIVPVIGSGCGKQLARCCEGESKSASPSRCAGLRRYLDRSK